MNVDQSTLLKQAFATSLSSSVSNLPHSAAKDVSGASNDKNQFRDMLDKKQQQTEKPSDSQTTKPTDQSEAPQKTDQTTEAPAEETGKPLEENELEARASEWLAALNVLTGNVQNVQNIQPVEVVEETAVPVAVETVATVEPVQEQAVFQQTVTEQAAPQVAVQETAPEAVQETPFVTQLAEEVATEVVQPQQQQQQAQAIEQQPTTIAEATTIEQAPVTQAVEAQPQSLLQEDDSPVLTQSNQTDTQEETVPVSVEQPVFDRVENIPVKVADPAPVVDTQQPQMLETIADTAQINLTQVGDTVRIQLKPENLGTITIELTETHGKIGLAVHAESGKTVELLTRHASELGALMENRTGREVTVQVQQNQPGEQPNDGRQNQPQQQQQQQQEHAQQQQPQSRDEQENFIQRLRLGFLDFTAQS